MKDYMAISKRNVVWILYGPEKDILNPFIINKFVSSRRLDFVAKLGYDVVHYAHKHCDSLSGDEQEDCRKTIGQVIVIGFR